MFKGNLRQKNSCLKNFGPRTQPYGRHIPIPSTFYVPTEPHRGHASRIFCCLLYFLLLLLLPVAVLIATFDVNCVFYGSLHFLISFYCQPHFLLPLSLPLLLPTTFSTATFPATSTVNHILYCHFYCHFYCQPHFLLPLLLPVVLPATFFTATFTASRIFCIEYPPLNQLAANRNSWCITATLLLIEGYEVRTRLKEHRPDNVGQ